MHAIRTSTLTALLLGLPLPVLAATDAQRCMASSGERAPLVVELYTSEGCSSCPPADRWLSTLKGRDDVIALAFHVDYWDRLGWKDRYASPAWTQRQYAVSARSGARFVYTPQVLLGGRDYRGWPGLPGSGTPSKVTVELAREGSEYVAQVTRRPGAPSALAGYWAVTEDGHSSQVKSGENSGALLKHDAVVRELREVADVGAAALRFTPQAAGAGSTSRRVQFVVIDSGTGLPVQAAALGC